MTIITSEGTGVNWWNAFRHFVWASFLDPIGTVGWIRAGPPCANTITLSSSRSVRVDASVLANCINVQS